MGKLLFHIGRYFVLMKRVFSRPERWRVFLRNTVRAIDSMGVSSIAIVLIISFFMGAVCAIQMAYNLQNPIIPRYLIGYGTRETLLLEFSSTMEMMGVNSASYLILPKIVGFVFFIPVLTIFSMAIGILGGYVASFGTKGLTPHDYVVGITSMFQPFYVTYSLVKSLVFAYIIASVSSYYGYYTNGGALDVGRSSTHAVVYSSIVVLLFNLILTKLML